MEEPEPEPEPEPNNKPHMIFLPLPAQGHIKSLLALAQLLNRSGFAATFVNSDLNQSLLEGSADMADFRDRFPGLRFASVPDRLPPDYPRNGSRRMEAINSTRVSMRPAFRELVVGLRREHGRVCVVSDVFMSFAVEIGEELGVPVVPFQSFGAYSTWVCLHIFKLVEDGYVPIPGDVDMEEPFSGVPGLDGILDLRRLDLPEACRCEEEDDPYLQFYILEMATLSRSPRIIINTFEALESPVIAKFRTSFFPQVYCVGPLHGLLETFKTKITSPPLPSSTGMLIREDKSCLSWLDTKPPRSVIYVSVGSWAGLSLDNLSELRHGLVNSGKWFLWVVRRDLIAGESRPELGTGERGCIVEWAPQEAVLHHPAVGGFLTHSGWNSTVESILAGVPMICWSQTAEQALNSRCVGEVWKIGIDIKGTCDRSTIERAVRDLMKNKREDLRRSMDEVAKAARKGVTEGGTSYDDLLALIEDLSHI